MSDPIPFDEIRRWMFEAALPLLANAGVGPHGFYEALDFEARPIMLDFKRTRVTGRQTYAFAHAAELGWKQGLALSQQGAELLNRIYQGPDEGWPRRLTPDNRLLDATPDLYDLAFVLFAYAWRYRV